MHWETRFALLALSSALLSAGCTSNAQPVTLRSLESSGRFSVLCLGTKDPSVEYPEYAPRDIDQCPDQSVTDGEARSAFAMVTQVARGEVAIVNMTHAIATGSPSVLDTEPTIPGFNFLPVGAQPTSIVTTPGGMATFVGVAEVGKEGIFGLPTSCALDRDPDAPMRDLTIWPACRLPSAPGEMAIILDRPPDPEQPNVYRQRCGEMPSEPTPQSERDCPADLSAETRHPGRRKLVVSLPDREEIVVIDAQELLDRHPGTYEPCTFEQQVRLEVPPKDTSVEQELPKDWPPKEPRPTGLTNPPLAPDATPHPEGFALVDDPTTNEHRLFIADSAIPVIHEVDTTDACALVEKPTPLLPLSFANPTRVVKTSKIAASPLTVPKPGDPPTAVTRYLYAVDIDDNGSVMFFDIGPGSTNRTPLTRTHAKLLPFEPPDRVAFDAPARDVTFALRDHVVADPATGSQQIGLFCNPDPNVPPTDPAAGYRPAADLSSGAAPSFLRGLFAFAVLQSGHIAVIDVQDFDAPCRRTKFQNLDPDEDFRGCANDPKLANGVKTYETAAGPTVTNEVTCQAVAEHRARSASPMRNDVTFGNHAPSLRTFPTLVSPTGRSLATNRTADGLNNPRMLGVDFSAKDKAEVWVGTTLFSSGDRENPLIVDPAQADQSSLVMSFREPRVFASQENFSATYEGVTVSSRPSGTIDFLPGKPGQPGQLTLTDGGFSFCGAGVEDVNIASERGKDFADKGSEFDLTDPKVLDKFASSHADHVEILADLLPDTDTYWQRGGASCGGVDPGQPGAGYQFCHSTYGAASSPNSNGLPSKDREFRILKAERNKLTIEAVPGSAGQKEKLAELLHCCFPTAVAYDVRASLEWVVRGSSSGYRHNVTTAPDGVTCAISLDPLLSRLQSRAIEVSCAGTDGVSDCARDENGNAIIGLATADDVACVYSAAKPFIPQIDNPDKTSGCLYNGLWASFAIYRGAGATLRNSAFNWTVVGGFAPQVLNIAAASDPDTSPTSMAFSRAIDGLILSDGSSKGLILVNLQNFAVTLNY